jgi:hypothetical protein
MHRFDGTAARQLDLLGDDERGLPTERPPTVRRPELRLLKKDIYAELTRRRRRAQIAARHLLEKE